MREESRESRESRENREDGGGDGERRSREIREFKEFREFREALSTFIHKAQPLILSLNSLFSPSSLFSLCPCSPQSAHYFSLEVPRFVTKSKLHWKGVYSVYISFQGNELGGEDWCLSREINFLSEGVRCGASEK